MEVTPDALEVIERYVRGNLGTWMRDAGLTPVPPRELELRERVTRVEVQLKVQRELMELRLEETERRLARNEKQLEDLRAEMIARYGRREKHSEPTR